MPTIKCKRCGATIRFVRTTKGALMPLDAEPTPKGNVILNQAGVAVVFARPPLAFTIRYMPHWATCPAAKEFRKNNNLSGGSKEVTATVGAAGLPALTLVEPTPSAQKPSTESDLVKRLQARGVIK